MPKYTKIPAKNHRFSVYLYVFDIPMNKLPFSLSLAIALFAACPLCWTWDAWT